MTVLGMSLGFVFERTRSFYTSTSISIQQLLHSHEQKDALPADVNWQHSPAKSLLAKNPTDRDR